MITLCSPTVAPSSLMPVSTAPPVIRMMEAVVAVAVAWLPPAAVTVWDVDTPEDASARA